VGSGFNMSHQLFEKADDCSWVVNEAQTDAVSDRGGCFIIQLPFKGPCNISDSMLSEKQFTYCVGHLGYGSQDSNRSHVSA
jgi:hypothetical protein